MRQYSPFCVTMSTPKWGMTFFRYRGNCTSMGNNLKKLREAAGWTHAEVAERMNVSRSQFIKLERGERRMTLDYIKSAARALGVHENQIIDAAAIPVIGYATANSRIEISELPLAEVPPPEGATDKTVGLRIDTDSVGQILKGWIAFFEDIKEKPSPEMLNKLCVVWLTDGSIYLKKLTEGTKAGHYKLESQFDPPIYDASVDFASPIEALRPQ